MKKHLNITNFCAQALLASCALTVGFGAAAQTSKEAEKALHQTEAKVKAAADKAAAEKAPAADKAAADKAAAANKAAADKAAADKAVVGTHGISKTMPVAVKK